MSPPHRGLPRPQSPGRTCPCPLNLTTGHAYRQLPTRLSVSPKQARARHPTFLARPRCAAWHTVGALAIFLERDVSNCRTEKLGWQQVRRWVWRGDRVEASGVGSQPAALGREHTASVTAHRALGLPANRAGLPRPAPRQLPPYLLSRTRTPSPRPGDSGGKDCA